MQARVTGDPKHLQEVHEPRRETDRWLAEAIRVATTSQEQELMAHLTRGYEAFFRQFDELAQPPLREETAARLHVLSEQYLATEIMPPAHGYLNFNQEVIQDTERA